MTFDTNPPSLTRRQYLPKILCCFAHHTNPVFSAEWNFATCATLWRSRRSKTSRVPRSRSDQHVRKERIPRQSVTSFLLHGGVRNQREKLVVNFGHLNDGNLRFTIVG
jgi:hypothetical protein